MAKQPESRFWSRFRKQFPQGMDVHIMRVENPACPGTPDVNVCVRGVETWMELKRVPKLPALAITPVFTGVLRPEQRLWHRLRSMAGGSSYFVGHVEQENLTYIIPGKFWNDFESMTREELDKENLKLEDIWDFSTGS